MKQVTLDDFLTPKETEQAFRICMNSKTINKDLVSFLNPLMPKINKKLGHYNDPSYLAYGIEHVFNLVKKNYEGKL